MMSHVNLLVLLLVVANNSVRGKPVALQVFLGCVLSVNSGHIELDSAVHSIKSEHSDEGQIFVEVYRHRSDMILISKFVTEARQRIDQALINHPSVVFEGALANNETLSEIVSGHKFLFIYLLPVNFDKYMLRIINRFKQVTPKYKAGLPQAFWKYINNSELNTFYSTKKISPNLDEAIRSYTKESMHEAKERLGMFSRQFKDMLIVEI